MQNNQVRIRVDALCDLQQFQEMFLNNEAWSKLIQFSLNQQERQQEVETPDDTADEISDETNSEESTEPKQPWDDDKPKEVRKRSKPKITRVNRMVRAKLYQKNILEVLQNGPLSPAEIKQLTGIPNACCDTIVYRLHKTGILKRERNSNNIGYRYSINKPEEPAQEKEPVQEAATEMSPTQDTGSKLPTLTFKQGLKPGVIKAIADYADPPSCAEISRKISKSAMVIRKVLEELCDEGYVEELHIKDVPTYDLTEKGLGVL